MIVMKLKQPVGPGKQKEVKESLENSQATRRICINRPTAIMSQDLLDRLQEG